MTSLSDRTEEAPKQAKLITAKLKQNQLTLSPGKRLLAQSYQENQSQDTKYRFNGSKPITPYTIEYQRKTRLWSRSPTPLLNIEIIPTAIKKSKENLLNNLGTPVL